MKTKVIFLIIFILSSCPLSAQVTALAQALARLNEQQEEWTITFVADELQGLQVETLALPEEVDVPEAVERLTKGLPVRVKVKKALRQIYVQRKRDNLMMTLIGKVQDNRTHNDLPGAVVQLLSRDSTVLSTVEAKSFLMEGDRSWYQADYYLNVPHRQESYILRAIYPGYDTTYVSYTLSEVGRREFTRHLPPIYMREETRHAMREVTVTASKVMFYYRGDTVVYNADAFQLAEGSMLDALVKQLPGVELKPDGRIYHDGKFVQSLLLNGKDFFNGDNQVMLENLPAYTVKQIEVYDKYGDKSDFLGQRLERDKAYVMDVRLKKEYSIGWLVNAEAGASPFPTSPKGEESQSGNGQAEKSSSPLGEDRRGLFRLFAMRFTDHSRLAAYFNANNLNDDERPGEEGGYSMGSSTGQQSRLQGGFDYFTEDRNKKWKMEGNVRAERQTNDLIQETARVNFLSSGDTREHSRSVAEDKSVNLNTWHQFRRNFRNVQMTLTPSLIYQRWDNHSDFTSRAFDTHDSLINQNRQQGTRNGFSLHPNLSTSWTVKLNGTSDYLEFETDACYDVKSEDHFNRQRVSGISPYYGDQYFKNHPDRFGKLWAQGMYHYSIRQGLSLETNLSYEYRNTQRESSLYLLDRLDNADTLALGVLPSTAEYERTMDAANSYNSHLIEHFYTLRPVLWWFPKVGKHSISLGLFLPMRLLDRTLHYQRGSVDTTLVHRTFLFDTGNSYAVWNYDKGRAQIQFFYRIKADAPLMLNYVNIRDATDPLNIHEGNPDLRNTHRHSLRINGLVNNREKHAKHNMQFDFNYTLGALAMSYLYNPETGVRTYRPYSVDGNWNTLVGYAYTQQLGKWQLTAGLPVNYIRSVDLTGTTQLERSTVSTTLLEPRLRVRYNFGELGNISMDGNPQWRWLHSPRTDFTDFHVADYKVRLDLLLNLPWKLQLSTDLTFNARRGYADASMNTNDWMWKARLARPFFKGNLVVMLDGYDLLGQQRSTTNVLNAQGRIETWTNVLPRYVLLHAVWRFNRQPMRKSERKRAREEKSKQ